MPLKSYYERNRTAVLARQRARRARLRLEREQAAKEAERKATLDAAVVDPLPPSDDEYDTPVYRDEFRVEPGRYVVTFD